MIRKIFSKKFIDLVENEYKKFKDSNLRVGNLIEIEYKSFESGKERIQLYNGIIIAIQNKGLGKSFILRRKIQGISLEQIFLYHSPNIISISKKESNKICRSKLYYLRHRIKKMHF